MDRRSYELEILSSQFHCRASLENDANAGAVAEHRFGAGRGYHNMVFLTLGTGLGSGIIINDRLYCGANDMAGEIGHVRLTRSGPVGYNKAGSAEGWASGAGMAYWDHFMGHFRARHPRFLDKIGKRDHNSVTGRATCLVPSR